MFKTYGEDSNVFNSFSYFSRFIFYHQKHTKSADLTILQQNNHIYDNYNILDNAC